MISIELLDTTSRKQRNEFVNFHYDLYKNCPQWVPPFRADIHVMMNRKKHPFYEHSDADFFLAKKDGKVVGRIAALENKPFNKYQNKNEAQFYLFDSIEDQEVFDALFEAAFEWAKKRGLTSLVGPKGFSSFNGYGIQVEGFEHRQMMTMMNYNYAYYPRLMEGMGFTMAVDFVSTYIPRDSAVLPEKVTRVAERIIEKQKFKVKEFKSKKELISWADPIGEAYNNTFVNNWEYYPLTKNEITFAMKDIMMVAVPDLMKIITYDDVVIGFLLAFPDVSKALQRHNGYLTPWGLIDMLLEMKRTKWVSLNGVGILPEYHGRGGNALLYYEMAKIIRESGFEHIEETQMADTAVMVRKDMITLGAEIYKKHRVYKIDIA
jgi:GNAT superfamily N-acetyltransferase